MAKATKSLKDQNRWQLWLAIVANAGAFYLVMQWDAITIDGIKTLITKASNFLPLGLTIVAVTVINGILSPEAKARIVFLRWRHALPGHRAFSELAPKDTRIDMDRLKKLCGNKFPTTPEEENSVWYALYKSIKQEPSVEHVQRDFLLTRDYASFVALATIGFGVAAFVELDSAKAALLYVVARAMRDFG